ncbi:hypothetical protein [Streptomyces sp. NPDC059593]|uniref:hypothetical protein n=1 Tax=Streptomyces sp. NPDC059593 TaxID=3346878 RepID=UPI0036C6F1EB
MDDITGTPDKSAGAGSAVALGLSLLLPAALIAFGIVFQLVTLPQLTGAPFFVAAPLMAAPLYTWWATLAFGAAALLSAVLLHLVAGTMWESAAVHDLATELATILFVTAVAILLNRVVRRERTRLASARGAAAAAQRAVLPIPPERLDGLHVASHYEAALEDTLIGGDLYAARSTPFGVRLVMGDVRGKGLGAIETVSVILGAFYDPADRLAGRTFSSPVRLLGNLVGDVKRFADGLTTDDMALLAAHRPRNRAPW